MSKDNLERDLKDGTTVPGYDPELGTRLKWTVDRIGSQKRAGEIGGVKPEMIGKYVAGKAKPSFYTVKAMATEAEASLDWIAYGEGAKRLRHESDVVDEEVLEAAITAVEMDLAERREVLEPKDKTRLISLLYKVRLRERNNSESAEPKEGRRAHGGT